MKSRNSNINNSNNLNNNISINNIDKLESQVNIIDSTSEMSPKKIEDVSKDYNGIINIRNLRLLFCFVGLQVINYYYYHYHYSYSYHHYNYYR